MLRWLPLALALASAADGQSGLRDRYFTRYPFDEWKAEHSRPQIKWVERIFPARLSVHQRLVTRIEVDVDAREIEKRRGRGEIFAMLEIADGSGRQWRTHQAFPLTRIPDDAKVHGIVYSQEAFMLPGDYSISLAVCDSQTLEHGFTVRTFHVAPVRNDPLPDAWRDLPPVEFVRAFDAPEAWFQPYVRGRLRLALPASRPVHIDLVMNLTPSERVSGSVRAFRRNMSVLVPALKLLSGMELPGGSLDVALLDLTRRLTWEQKNVHAFDWAKMREPFANGNPGVIDVQSLAAKAEMKQFFLDQVLDRAGRTSEKEPLHVVIVLSAPMFLENQFKVEPAAFEKDPNRRVYYLRYRPLPPMQVTFDPFNGGLRPIATPLATDDIERTLKVLDARVLVALTPEDFRKAVASMLADIARM
jgi:hypothetical protein